MFSGLSLLYPLALLSALAVVIPLAIHLFNRARPKTVLLGSVHLIPRTAQQPINQLHVQQRLLLAIRIGLIVLLAIFLAQVVKQNAFEQISQEPIILVTPNWLSEASAQDKQALLSAIETQQGYVLGRQLQPVSESHLEAGSELVKTSQQDLANIWAMLALHLNRWPPDQQWQVYTTDQASQFIGGKTPLPQNITWRVLQDGELDSANELVSSNSMSVTLVYDNDSREALQVWQRALSFLVENGFNALSYQAVESEARPEANPQTWYVDLTQPERSAIGSQPQLNALKSKANHPEFVLSLAESLITLSQQQEKQISGHLSPQQIAALTKPDNTTKLNATVTQPPTWWSWLPLVIALLFILERWLSEAAVSSNKEEKE